MSTQLTREYLVSRGVRYVVEGNDIFFSLSDVKKNSAREVKVRKADLIKKEIDGKHLQVVKLSDIELMESVEVTQATKDIEVTEAEFVPCGEGCGCAMSQEEAEKALCEYENLNDEIQKILNIESETTFTIDLKKALSQNIESKKVALENYNKWVKI